MEKTTYDKIAKIWEKCKRGDKTCPRMSPSIYFAIDENDRLFYTAKDYSTICFFVLIRDNKPYTFAIPKKYCTEIEKDGMKFYRITKSSKLDLVSCSNNQIDDFDLFVVKNIISKIDKK